MIATLGPNEAWRAQCFFLGKYFLVRSPSLTRESISGTLHQRTDHRCQSSPRTYPIQCRRDGYGHFKMTAAPNQRRIDSRLILPSEKVTEKIRPRDHRSIMQQVRSSQISHKSWIVKNSLPLKRKQNYQRQKQRDNRHFTNAGVVNILEPFFPFL